MTTLLDKNIGPNEQSASIFTTMMAPLTTSILNDENSFIFNTVTIQSSEATDCSTILHCSYCESSNYKSTAEVTQQQNIKNLIKISESVLIETVGY